MALLMPTTVIPVVGKVDQKFVYMGGALIVGILGYAWLSKSRTAPPADVAPAVPLPADDYVPNNVVDSTGSFGPNPPTGPPPIAADNVQWSSMAREQAAAFGIGSELANSAIGHYLGRQPMTATEVAILAPIIAVLGAPPTGGPYPLIPSLPTPPVGGHGGEELPAPAGFNPVGVSPTQVALQWSRVPGAITYQVRRDGGPWQPIGSVERIIVPSPSGTHSFSVRAVDGSGKPGAASTASASTISQTQVNENLAHFAGRN
jgi:hypothetical protein